MAHLFREPGKALLATLYRWTSAFKPRPTTSPQLTRIAASQGWGRLHLAELWEYRDLIYFLVWCDIKSRYRQMAFGPLWIVLQPLFTVATSTIIFGLLAKLPSDGVPYPLFNYAALLPWTFFANSVSRAAGSLVGYQHLISKVYFPRLIVPIVSVLSGLMDLGISLLLLVGVAWFYGFHPSWGLWTLPLFVGLAIATALAIGFWLAALLVRFRDVAAFLSYMLQAWMYASPVVYSLSLVPPGWRFFYQLNPMAGVTAGFRWALLGVGQPSALPILLSALLTLSILIPGMYYFCRTERTIVDSI